jgi:large subunit ribosomal protein L25
VRDQIEIPVELRSVAGKSAARRLRAAGKIPAVIYGRGMESLPVAVDAATFARALQETAWYSTLVRLRVEGGSVDDPNPSVMISEVQRHPIRQQILSIDFHRISLREKLHTQVPVIHVKQSPGVRMGGILEHITHDLTVECLPGDIPDHLEADISGLHIGEALRVRDLVPPPGVRILSPADEVVILVAPPVRAEEVAAAPAQEGAVVAETEEPEVIGEREARG